MIEILVGDSDPHHGDVDAGEGEAYHDVLEGGEDVDEALLDVVPLRRGRGRWWGGGRGGEVDQHGEEDDGGDGSLRVEDVGHVRLDLLDELRVGGVGAGGVAGGRLRHDVGEDEGRRYESRHLSGDHHSRGRGPLVRREPLDAEYGQGALDHDAGPAVKSPAEEAGPLED